jgi:hypothetical protein
MLSGFVRFSLIVACFSLTSLAATAQQVVHALAGTVTSINPNAKTITVKTDDGSEGLFKDLINSKTSIQFDPNIRTDATAASDFKNSGVRVIVYYFGNGDVRTVVALRSLGSGPFTITTGTVAGLESGAHTISIKDKSGVVQAFTITSNTVVETGMGAREGFSFQPQKGDRVRVTAATVNGIATAQFINTLVVD